MKSLKATLTFTNRQSAKDFAKWWASVALEGHDLSATKGDGSTEVTVYNITETKKIMLDNWIESELAQQRENKAMIELAILALCTVAGLTIQRALVKLTNVVGKNVLLRYLNN